MRIGAFDFDNILWDKKSYEILYECMKFMTFHTKSLLVQNQCVSGSTTWMDLLKLMMEPDI